MDQNWWLIGIALLLSGFFSGIEIAFISSNKLRMELENKRGGMRGRMLAYFMKHPSQFLTTTLVGNNIALVIYGYFAAAELNRWLPLLIPELGQNAYLMFISQTVVSSLLVLIAAEFIPKALFSINPDHLMHALYLPMSFFYGALYPVVIFTDWLSRNILRRLLGLPVQESEPAFDKFDLFHLVEESRLGAPNSANLRFDKDIFRRALGFAQVKVRECMIPRTELVAINVKEGVEALRERFMDSAHSKILIYEDSIDNILGYVHISELFSHPTDLRSLILPAQIVTESMPAIELMRSLIEQQRSMAVVVDEFGGTGGLVTIEDIMEEIFGEIEDEHDTGEQTERQLSPTEYVFSARLEVDYINEKYQLNLPEGDYETLGGLILEVHRSIPEEGEIIRYPPYEFQVMSVESTRILDVRVVINPSPDA